MSATSTTRAVAAGLDRVTAAIHAVPYAETRDPREHARRADRLHVLYARRARWWSVLERAASTDPSIPTVFVHAVILARCVADQHATDYAVTADRWIDHARATETAGAGRAEPVRGVSA